MKKILSIIVIIFMTLEVSYAKISYTEQLPQKTDYGYKQADLLNKFEIIDEIPVLKLGILRGEMCSLLARTVFLEQPTQTGEIFADVTKETKYANEINALYDAGYISGYIDGYFRPENRLSYNEATMLCLRALGINDNYEAKAQELGLYEGMDNKDNDFTYADLYIMVVNMLNIKVSDKTLLEDRFNIFKYEGVVTDDGITKIDGQTTLKATQLKINNGIYNWGKVVNDGILGMYIEGYYIYDEKENVKTIITADVNETKTSSIKMPVSDVKKLTSTELKYFKSEKTEKIAPDADCIYNGVWVKDITEKMLENAKLGEFKLIDSNLDNVYDIVSLNSYKTMVVSEVNAEEKHVFGKYNEKVDLSQKENIFVYRDNKSIDLSKLHDFDVIAIIENEKTWSAWVINKAVCGTVSKVTNNKLTINGEEYSLAEEFRKSRLIKPKFNNTGMFYITLQNKIAYFENIL